MRGLSAQALRIFAALCMLLDHVGAVFFPQAKWMNMMGRLAFPIFAFLITEGFAHTRSWKRYGLRLFMLAVVSEPFFDGMTLAAGEWTLDTGGLAWLPALEHQNTVFTLLIGLLVLQLNLYSEHHGQKIFGFLVAACGGILAELLRFDYGAAGILMIYMFWILRGDQAMLAVMLVLVNAVELGGIQSFAALAILPILLYHGEKGRTDGWLRWINYLFYPLHLAVIGILKFLI